MRRLCTPPDQRDIAKREARRPLELAEREVLEQWQDVALERAEIDQPSDVSPLAAVHLPFFGAAVSAGRRVTFGRL